jgi:hypothetical protein
MAIPIPLLPEGTRVRIRRSALPQAPALTGREGVVVQASEYMPHMLAVVLDGESALRQFAPGELEVVQRLTLPAEREQAKRLRALP